MLPRKPSPPPSPQLPNIDLRLCLLNLPTPILAVCQSRTAIFTNRAAEKLLTHDDHIQRHPRLIGRQLADFDIRLLNNATWDTVFGKFIAAQDSSSHGRADKIPGEDIIVHEVEAVVEKPGRRDPQRFRILLSSLMGDDGLNYILSFEYSPHVGIKLTTGVVSWDSNISTTGLENKPKAGELHDEQRYKLAVFDSSRIAAFIISSDEKSYVLNKKLRVLLRHSIGDPQDQDDLNISTWLDLWDERFTRRMREEELPGFRLIRAKKPYRDCCYGLTGPSTDRNKMFIVNISGECLYDDGGNFIGGVCWFTRFQNLPEYWAAEKERGLRSYESICNRLPHMAWTTTANGEADWFSQRWYEYTGMTEDEAAGAGFSKAFHPEDRAKILSQVATHNETKEDYHVEFRFRRHDGCYRWMLARACPILDENGQILRWYGSNTDIHDGMLARLHADNIKDQIMAVLAHADVSLFAINRDKQVTMAEGGALGIVGRIRDRFRTGRFGSNVVDIARACDDAGSATFEKNLLAILAGDVSVTESEDEVNGRVHRTRMVADSEVVLSDDGKNMEVKGVLGLIIDVTDMKARTKLELDNARLTAEEQAAKDSNRMKSQFLANMSHELRTPTSGVIGMVDLLTEDETLSEEQRECVNSIQLSAKALLTIVNDILDFSKIESGRFDIEEVPFNLASTINGLCQLLTMFANQKGLEFICENSLDETLELLGDAGRIRQVLSNLLMNAMKFTTKGRITIAITGKRIESKAEGHETLEVQFVIEDTGVGIEKEVLDKLFKPFHQGDASTARLYGGTGLGLTISKNLASLMNGTISLTSTPAVGSTATFTLPLKVASWSGSLPIARSSVDTQMLARSFPRVSTHRDILKQQMSEMATSDRNQPHAEQLHEQPVESDGGANTLTPEQRSNIHVLLVEDNAINQTIALKIIRKLGFPVVAVWNGLEALDYLLNCSTERDREEEKPPTPDIILMDVQMPVMDGYEATRNLRSGKEYAVQQKKEDGKGMGKQVKDGMESLRNLPIIAMTASAIQGDNEKCKAAGMDDYLPKPVDKEKLEEMLVKWARKSKKGM